MNATQNLMDDYGTQITVRRCGQCGIPKVQRIGNFTPRKRHPKTRQVLSWSSYCGQCRNSNQRKRWAEMPEEERRAIHKKQWRDIKSDPEKLEERRRQHAERERRAREENPSYSLDAKRAHYWRRKADPAKHAEYLESQRMQYRLRQERKLGVHVDDLRQVTVKGRKETVGGHLPARPLGEKLMAEAAKILHGNMWDELPNQRNDDGKEAVALRAGTASRSIFAWATGEREFVQFNVADAVLVRMGWAWWDVWPDDEMVRRAFEGDEEAAA